MCATIWLNTAGMPKQCLTCRCKQSCKKNYTPKAHISSGHHKATFRPSKTRRAAYAKAASIATPHAHPVVAPTIFIWWQDPHLYRAITISCRSAANTELCSVAHFFCKTLSTEPMLHSHLASMTRLVGLHSSYWRCCRSLLHCNPASSSN